MRACAIVRSSFPALAALDEGLASGRGSALRCFPEPRLRSLPGLGDLPRIPGGGTERRIQRGACYKRPEEDRQLRVARYLSGRIDRITTKEDEQLIEWCWEAAFSSGFDGGDPV